jgi:hypothetical protein
VAADHLPPRFGGPRCFSTAICFLLEGHQRSHLHRIRSDEVWHFYHGAPVSLVVLRPDGSLRETVLGSDPERGELFQVVVEAGCWYGARVRDPSGYALLGGTVAPGFDFADFELGAREALLRAFPRHRAVIEDLTPEPPASGMAPPPGAGVDPGRSPAADAPGPVPAGCLFRDLPAGLRLDEEVVPLVETTAGRIERIVSTGQATPEGRWLVGERDEWVVLLRGAAGLAFEGEPGALTLGPGDWVWIPAGRRHRVAWTAPAGATVWLAVHLPPAGASPPPSGD